ncbi:MAG: hypothetical protein A2161_19810 [Candidatus Schekmanbacteria bacterium RBG_13_48_7]|uniref:Transposase IS200-like domain-containing protein n=1 Tax=Candidatus Schekmanbacteria bacterium RBG_13_48_7 TaxID=1817878 RepID=A0A1F7S1M5_9BACT|nr:MAG: hypothetical protein A2161_19810 [Candidatus Schekmanbacteria bacterium RBG_13_48_7]
MSRNLRIEIPDGIYHVTSRGLERREIYYDDHDRSYWLSLFGSVAQRHEWRILSWVLMDNHYHIFLRTPHADLSVGMHELNAGYVTTFNKRHKRVGPLFQGRYKGILVERGYHYWELSRYIHLNPVRVDMVKDPEAYKWSSCRHFFRYRGRPDWLAWEEVLIEHGKTIQVAQRAYRQFLREGVESPPGSPLKFQTASTILGSPGFIERMKTWLDGKLPDKEVPAARKLAREISVETVVIEVCREYRISRNHVKIRGGKNNESREVAIYLCRKWVRTPVEQLGTFFGGVQGTAIANMVTKIRKRLKHDPDLRAKLVIIENNINNE